MVLNTTTTITNTGTILNKKDSSSITNKLPDRPSNKRVSRSVLVRK
jgi:hypothetical protein